ncbi:MAG: DUF2791 family P-loop domain-containing protein [Rhodospirillales bacterium]|nr:DUF2791 family P-loop domain-containing protein [Rhodospirillales bacterium]
MNTDTRLDARSAIEALRAGVPNRAAIRRLGTPDSPLVHDFETRLRASRQALRDDRPVDGIVIAGAFGAGKSHQLGYLAECAGKGNFVVSLLPISKETPLFDPARLFAAAIRAAVVPDANDDVMTAAMHRLVEKLGRYDDLELWTSGEVKSGRLSSMFAALLWLIPKKSIEPDILARIARFFGGAKLSVTDVKRWLRETGASKLFPLSPVRAPELSLQRLRFAPRLLAAAGFEGWCILLDEVELIGRYSAMQRGKSYAELARWLGMDEKNCVPGILTVAAITEDFSNEMFDQKADDEKIPQLLEQRGLAQQAEMARKGIARLKRQDHRLNAPGQSLLLKALETIRILYDDAYGWIPPDTEMTAPQATKFMRQYVRSWITTWDIQRLYRQETQIEVKKFEPDYSESDALEQSPDADEGNE